MSERRIPLARPRVGRDEVEALRGVLDSGVLSRGEALTGFEADLAALAGSARARRMLSNVG